MEPSMKITEIKPYAVFERFPEHEETIKQLFKIEYNFKLLCSDYRRCFKALEFWSKSDLSEARQRKEEYKSLLAELEMEVFANLNNR